MHKVEYILMWLLDLLELYSEKRQRNRTKRQFLHLDLDQLKYTNSWRRKFADIRYLDEDGRLKVHRFRLSEGTHSIRLTETRAPILPAKYPKGPATFKQATHEASKYMWFGLIRRKVWDLGYYQIL